jgi:hypothetical protein
MHSLSIANGIEADPGEVIARVFIALRTCSVLLLRVGIPLHG